jgi:hypothetical protein
MSETRRVTGKEKRTTGADLPLFTGNFGISEEIKHIASDDLKRCRYSREQIALALSGQVGRDISIAMIDAWVSSTHQHRFPLDILPAWVRVTGSARLLEFVCNQAGLHLSNDTEFHLAEYGRRVIERERAGERESRLKTILLERI